MVALTVVIGGITRLTESGLSITEWRPVSGVLPPLSAGAWEAEFAKYRAIPEYRIEHADLTLAGFQRIYLIEYGHRLWARLTGLALALPLALGLWRGWFSRPTRRRLVGMLLLTGLQGAMGWVLGQREFVGHADAQALDIHYLGVEDAGVLDATGQVAVAPGRQGADGACGYTVHPDFLFPKVVSQIADR